MTRIDNGRTFGNPGGGLDNASWAANSAVAAQGQRGEVRTAQQLAKFQQATVLHDLRCPGMGGANLDHVVVSGQNVVIVDAKCWRAGIYWTIGATTRRGFETFEHAGFKGTWGGGRDAIAKFLTGTAADVQVPVVAIWPASGSITFVHLRFTGGDAIHGRDVFRQVRHWAGDHPANPAIVERLLPLVTGMQS